MSSPDRDDIFISITVNDSIGDFSSLGGDANAFVEDTDVGVNSRHGLGFRFGNAADWGWLVEVVLVSVSVLVIVSEFVSKDKFDMDMSLLFSGDISGVDTDTDTDADEDKDMEVYVDVEPVPEPEPAPDTDVEKDRDVDFIVDVDKDAAEDVDVDPIVNQRDFRRRLLVEEGLFGVDGGSFTYFIMPDASVAFVHIH